MSRDWQNFFTAEDFLLAHESLNPGLSVAYILSDKANIILREKLKKAKRVYSTTGDSVWCEEFQKWHSRTALLIDEKKL